MIKATQTSPFFTRMVERFDERIALIRTPSEQGFFLKRKTFILFIFLAPELSETDRVVLI